MVVKMILKPIPTNVITGFLGVGKTSLIRRLLAQKPNNERWAVLVNEFGEVGIDAALMGAEEGGITIREVAGGCMCCASGIPMQVALNQLIAKAKPDRLLIEPTGLGHPAEVLKLLSAAHFKQVIDLRATVCLVDARKVTDIRYRDHAIFNQQLQVGDILLATKSDHYCDTQMSELETYLNHVFTPDELSLKMVLPISLTDNAQSLLPRELLVAMDKPAGGASSAITMINQGVAFNCNERVLTPLNMLVFELEPKQVEQEFDERGILVKTNQNEGHYSYGWIFSLRYEFNFDGLIELARSLVVLRFKAMMITDEGIVGLNGVDGEFSIIEFDDAMDSRVEIISLVPLDFKALELRLLAISTRLNF